MDNESVLRPRWGAFSVIDHQRLASLIPEILLYDRLVFPTPTDADRARWECNGWDPILLDQRIKELGDLVHPTPWTQELREQWSVRWERLKQLGRDTQDLALNLTPHVLAISAWQDRFPPPIMIAAYQDAAIASADLALIEDLDVGKRDQEKLHRAVGALFERRMEMPIVEDPQRSYEKVIGLAHNKDYQHARRSLFEWEDQRVTNEWPTEAAIQELEKLVDAHDDLIKSTFQKTWKRRVFHVLQFVTPALITVASTEPLVGLAAGGLLKLVEARFPSITASPGDPLDSPGAALHMAISVMYHDPSREV